MDILDRLLAHDLWITRQLLLACRPLPAELLDQELEFDQRTLRRTDEHIISNMEVWTDLLDGRPVQNKTGDTIAALLERLSVVGREFAHVARQMARERRYDDSFRGI